MNHDDATNSGGSTPGSKLPASPPLLSRPGGGGQPWPCTCVHGPEKNYAVGSLPAPEDLHNQDVEHLVNGLQQGNLMICSPNQGKRPLRHDSDVDDLDMHNNGHVNNITKNGTCGISTVCTQTALNVPVSEHNGHVKLVQELHLWHLHGLVRAQFALCVPVSVAKQRP